MTYKEPTDITMNMLVSNELTVQMFNKVTTLLLYFTFIYYKYI